MVTKDQALVAREFHYGECSLTKGPRGGVKTTIEAWRRNGATQVWKTRPDDWQIPVKRGLKTYGVIRSCHAHSFHAAEDCPVLCGEEAPHE